MITSFNTKRYDITGQMNAVAMNTVDILSNNESLRVYIPKVMTKIKKGTPKISIIQSKGKSVFKNANKKPILTGNLLFETNYFTTSLNATSNIDDLNNSTNNIIKELNSQLNAFASANKLSSVESNKKMSYKINKNTSLRVEFLNGKIDKLAFTTLDKTKSTQEIK